jgi:hypothetical protein
MDIRTGEISFTALRTCSKSHHSRHPCPRLPYTRFLCPTACCLSLPHAVTPLQLPSSAKLSIEACRMHVRVSSSLVDSVLTDQLHL